MRSNKEKKLKPKKCAVKTCRITFTPRNGFQKVCTPLCAIKFVQQQKEEKARKQTAKQKRDFYENDKGHWREKAQKEFNKFIRLRDHELPCISCDKPSKKYDAGHYRTVGAAGHLRFNEDNCHKQCGFNCNSSKAGNVVEYRIRLVRKIGVERVEALENNNDIVKWTLEDFKRIFFKYQEKNKILERELGLK